MAPPKKVPQSFRMSPEVINKLRAIAYSTGLSQASILQMAVREYYDGHDGPEMMREYERYLRASGETAPRSKASA